MNDIKLLKQTDSKYTLRIDTDNNGRFFSGLSKKDLENIKKLCEKVLQSENK